MFYISRPFCVFNTKFAVEVALTTMTYVTLLKALSSPHTSTSSNYIQFDTSAIPAHDDLLNIQVNQTWIYIVMFKEEQFISLWKLRHFDIILGYILMLFIYYKCRD